MPENLSTGIEATVTAVTQNTGVVSRPRGEGGKFAAKKSTPQKQDVTRMAAAAFDPDGERGQEREIGDEPLARKENRDAQREAFDRARGRNPEKAQPAAKAQEPAAESAQDEEQPEGDEPAGKQGKEQHESKEVEIAAARLALIRSGFKPKEVDAMPRAELLQRGAARAKHLAKEDAAFESQRHKKAESSKGNREQNGEETQPAPLFKADALKSLAKTLGLEDSEAKGLEGPLTEFIAPIVAKVKELETALQAQASSAQESAIDQARQQLRERFPELDDPDRFEEVEETMQVLAQLPKYRSGGSFTSRVSQLMRDAAVNAGLQESTKNEDAARSESERDARKERRANGRPTSDVRGAPKPATKAAQDRAFFDARRSGEPLEVARRLAGIG